MARQFIPVADPAIVGLVNATNLALAPLLTQAIQGISFGALDQARHMGREYQLLVTHDTGTAVLAAPFQVVGFEGTDPLDVATQMAAWVAAHPALWFSPAFTVGLPAVRYDRQQAGFLFSCTDAVNAPTMWEMGGSGGGGGGDHSLLINRDIIDQHPALAITFDAISHCHDAATTTLDTLKIQVGLGAAAHYEVFVSDVTAPDDGFVLGRFSMATGPAGGAPAVNLTVDCAGANAVPGCTLGAAVLAGNLLFQATVAGLAAGVNVAWRRVNMTPSI